MRENAASRVLNALERSLRPAYNLLVGLRTPFCLCLLLLSATLRAGGAAPPPANDTPGSGRKLSAKVLSGPEDLVRFTNFDGDGESDLTLFEPSSGDWSVLRSSNGATLRSNWGYAVTVPVLGEYDGDGQADVAVFEPATGNWYIRESASGMLRIQNWGYHATVPVPADYDGDAITDIAVYDPAHGSWFILRSSDGQLGFAKWGYSATLPVAADYDGDGQADIAVYEPSSGNWYIRESATASLRVRNWGYAAAMPVPGYYDNDAKADVAVFERSSGKWFIRNSATGTMRLEHWGWSATEPVPDDYDGDHLTDLAVYHPASGDWYVQQSRYGGALWHQTWCQGATISALPQYQVNKRWGFTLAPVDCGAPTPVVQRLIVFGESVSAGADATPGMSYGEQLRDSLSEKFSAQVDYINVAVGGSFASDLAFQRAALESVLPGMVEGHSVVVLSIGAVDILQAYGVGFSMFEPLRSEALAEIATHVIWLHDRAKFPDGVSIYVMFFPDPTDGLSSDPWCFALQPAAPISDAIQYWSQGYAELSAAMTDAGAPFTYVDIITPFLGHAHNHTLFGLANYYVSPPCGIQPCQGADIGGCVHPNDLGHTAMHHAVMGRIDAAFP